MSGSDHSSSPNVPSGWIPTGHGDLTAAVRIARTVLGRPAGVSIAIIAAAATIVLSTTVQNSAVVVDVVLGGGVSPASRVRVAVTLLPGVGAPLTVGDVTVLLIAFATGVVAALATYQIRSAARAAGGVGGVSLGVIAAAVGGGCASCGSAVLTALLGVGVANGSVILPFDGLAVSWTSIMLLGLSAYRLTGINANACEV